MHTATQGILKPRKPAVTRVTRCGSRVPISARRLPCPFRFQRTPLRCPAPSRSAEPGAEQPDTLCSGRSSENKPPPGRVPGSRGVTGRWPPPVEKGHALQGCPPLTPRACQTVGGSLVASDLLLGPPVPVSPKPERRPHCSTIKTVPRPGSFSNDRPAPALAPGRGEVRT